ncbi:MAG TPA: hypothetical protein VHA80_03295 [Solirubrobacterales bacterium]|nr:hypothetical protein [Solirubrobacterales bacterium]
MADTLISRPTTTDARRRLAALGVDGRTTAYEEGRLTGEELYAWAALYPEEVPLINDELPWIAANAE